MCPKCDFNISCSGFVSCQFEFLCRPSHILLHYRWVQKTTFKTRFARQYSVTQQRLCEKAFQNCVIRWSGGILILHFLKWLQGCSSSYSCSPAYWGKFWNPFSGKHLLTSMSVGLIKKLTKDLRIWHFSCKPVVNIEFKQHGMYIIKRIDMVPNPELTKPE